MFPNSVNQCKARNERLNLASLMMICSVMQLSSLNDAYGNRIMKKPVFDVVDHDAALCVYLRDVGEEIERAFDSDL